MSDSAVSDSAVRASESSPTPMLSVTGGATPHELAAVVAVIASLHDVSTAPQARRVWGTPSSGLRSMPAPGPGAWRTSALPR